MPLSIEGTKRTFLSNVTVAFVLAGVAGFVNMIGFLQLGIVTSHATGTVTRMGQQIGEGNFAAASHWASLVAAFLGGAMLATLFVERARYFKTARFQAALLLEAALLTAYLVTNELASPIPEALHNPLAILLSASMGLQNALVTRLSGAVVRTTHLTGVLTDFGIELVRLAFWFRARTKGRSIQARVLEAARVRADPELHRARLHLTIIVAFTVGATAAVEAVARMKSYAMLPPILALIGLVAYDRLVDHGEAAEGDYEVQPTPAPDSAKAA